MVFSSKEEIQRIVGERNGEDTKLKRMEKRGEGDEDAAQRGSERRKEGRKERKIWKGGEGKSDKRAGAANSSFKVFL